jgi:hypothetical protein
MNPSNYKSNERSAKISWCKIERSFAISAGFIFVLAGIAKIWTSLTGIAYSVPIFKVIDPLSGLFFGHLMFIVGCVELTVAYFCFSEKFQKISLWLISLLATNFALYHFGLWWIGWTKPCSCLGNFSDAIHMSPSLVADFFKLILVYLFAGSYLCLIQRFFSKWRHVT